jgi:sugar lactone lactonase YvrE
MNRGVFASSRDKHSIVGGGALIVTGLLVVLYSFAGLVAPQAHAFANGQAASVLLGQQNFASVSQYRATGPAGIAFDSSGNLWVADAYNNRVLRFPATLANGIGADVEIGQTSFIGSSAATSQSGLHNPTAVTFDPSGNLWVTDAFDNRILRFAPPFTSGMSANLVIGQASFTTSLGLSITTQSSLYSPWNIAFDSSGNLWVADCGDNRVLRFAPPFSNGLNANLVIGQSGFTTFGSATTQTGTSCPISLSFDSSGYLWVSDSSNNRVLRFGPQFSNGTIANLVIGQASFTAGAAAASQAGLSGPSFLTFDSRGDLWVVDISSSRVLEFLPPFTIGMGASVVIGQPTFTSTTGFAQAWFNFPDGLAFDSSGNLWVSDNANGAILRFPQPFITAEASNLVIGQGQNTLTIPRGLFLDSSGNLWVGDSGNNRVLRFSPSFSNGMSANLVIGQGDFGSNWEVTAQSRLTSAGGVLMDSSGNLWVSDFYSNRILRFSPPFTSGMSANLVLGQTSFAGNSASATQAGLSTPKYFAFDSAGDLWVADQSNNRVLMFAPPFSNGMAAALVIGQTGFTSSASALSQGGLSNPAGVAFDSSGNLWVADQNNNRTIMFPPPFTNGMNANLVLGQAGFTTSGAATGSGGLLLPRIVAFDSAGNIWVSEQTNNRVMRFACGSECPASSVSFSFSVQGGGTGYSPPTLTYMSGGAPRNATLTGQPTAVSIDYGSSWSVSSALPGSTSGERWSTPQAVRGTATATQTLGLTYYHQFNSSLAFRVIGGGTGYSAPNANFSQFGSTKTTGTNSSVWADSGSSYSFAALLPGSTSVERWSSKSTSGTVSSAGSITAPYFHQFNVSATYSVSGGGSPQPPVLSSTQFGAAFNMTLTGTASSTWLDSAAAWKATNTLGGSTTSERWIGNATAGTVAKAAALASPGSSSLVYLHQFLLTVTASPTGGGSVSPPGDWFSAGSSVSMSATPGAGYQFAGWAGSGAGSYTGPNNPASITMNSPVVEAAGFVVTSTTASSTSSTTSSSTSTASSSQTSAGGGGGGIPELPYQVAATALLTVIIVASYILNARRGGSIPAVAG